MLMLAATVTSGVMAQETAETKKKVVKPSRDFVMIQLTYENWSGTPDNVKIGGIGRGFGAFLCYDFPISKSNFSFAAGIGINNSNIYFDNQLAILNSSSSSIKFQNVDTAANQDLYKKSKLSMTYLEAPFELRFFGDKENRNRGFKAAIGMHVGLLIGAHSKNKNTVAGPAVVEKVNSKRYMQTWKFAPTARIGWGNFSVYGSYNLSPMFNNGEGPEVFPYSVGITITGL
ncbi:outer membrane protein with beta-barrel domain [Taibaiella chishuiensis]|uniref:Outer membrane protein with beta-barrel domain n=2 Tax=Taibaiella chishuiensis TaxID=1434707 RepID=A0A2P8DBS7_9BACT|nr:outer membrane protein with beta-barrel domain [Taibaiella chishuiensis]